MADDWIGRELARLDRSIRSVRRSIPDGLSDLIGRRDAAILTGFASAVAGASASSSEIFGNLVAFGADPAGFILNVVLVAIVNLVLDAGAFVVGVVDEIWSLVAGIPALVFSPIFDTGAMLQASTVSVILSINEAVIAIAAGAGPAAPLVVIVTWVLVGLAITWTIYVVLAVVRWI